MLELAAKTFYLDSDCSTPIRPKQRAACCKYTNLVWMYLFYVHVP